MPPQNQPSIGRGVNLLSGRGRGNIGGVPGRGLPVGPRGDSPQGPGLGRGRAVVLQQGRGGSAPVPVGRGVQRTLRQVNTSTNVQQAPTSPHKPVTRQVLARGTSPKGPSNGTGRGAKTVVTTLGRGRGIVNAPKAQSLASRLGPPLGTVKGRGRGLLGAITQEATIPGSGPEPKGRAAVLQAATKPVGRTTRSMVNKLLFIC